MSREEPRSSPPLEAAERLGTYTAPDGARHEILALDRKDGSTLVLDAADTLRLVGRIAADEPPGNAALLARLYLADETRGRCRTLEPGELDDTPAADERRPPHEQQSDPVVLQGADGRSYRIAEVAREQPGLELRWVVDSPDAATTLRPLRLREVVASLQAYEPACSITAQALANTGPQGPCTRQLAQELARLNTSPIVLNRGLREAVHRAQQEGLTLSEIAIRCGRTKADAHGRRSGETSWLARRIGQMPEAGRPGPTPWVHSDTLALIARQGLGLAPREVEL